MFGRGGSEGHGADEDGSDDSLPSEDWIDAFAAQCTAALWESARAYARKRAAVVRTVSDVADSDYADELVQNAIGDTFRGVRRWDPAAGTLAQHIYLAIQSRTNHDYEHAKRFQRESIDPHDVDDPPLAAEVDAAIRDDAPPSDPDRVLLARQRWAQVRTAAASHPSATAILDATLAGASSKEEVMQYAGLSEKEYHAGYVHLTRLRIPADEPSDIDPPHPRKKGR